MKKTFAIVLCIAFSCTMYADNQKPTVFPIQTNNKAITGTLTTFSEDQFKIITGSKYLPYTEEPEPLETAHKHFMIIRVTIENNSDEPLYLEKNNYLSRIKDFFVSKHEFAKLYPNIAFKKFGCVLGGVFSASFTVFFWWALHNPSMMADVSQGDSFLIKYLGIPFFILGTIASAQYFIRYGQVGSKQKMLEKSAALYKKETSKLRKAYNLKADRYKVPPACVFQDFFFVSLKHADPAIFHDITPELVYTTT